MAEKNFAFESEEVSIAFYSLAGMGDVVIARKVLEALVELAPDCLVDVVCATEGHTAYTKAFYGDIKNLNRLIIIPEYVEHEKKYDLALGVGGCHATLVKFANIKRLEALAPALAQSVLKIIEYNNKNFVSEDTWRTYIALRNMISAKILGKSYCEFLSCDGALPIRDNKINIPLASEYQSKFDELKFDKYITIYTNISESEKARPKVKTWPIRYWYEYVARMKNRFPQIEIIQLGGY